MGILSPCSVLVVGTVAVVSTCWAVLKTATENSSLDAAAHTATAITCVAILAINEMNHRNNPIPEPYDEYDIPGVRVPSREDEIRELVYCARIGS